MFDKNKRSAVIALTTGLSVLSPGIASADKDDGMDNDHLKRARDFLEFMLSDAQQIYTDGGFPPLTGAESAERYSFDKDGNVVIETFSP